MKNNSLKNCPFCGEPVALVNSPMLGIKMIYCSNRQGCGATVSFDNPVANKEPSKTHIYWNRRKRK